MADSAQILVTGGAGQVGAALRAHTWPDDVTVLAPSRIELDLTDAASVVAWFTANKVAAVINTAAYTAVDRAETEVAEAFAANAIGPALLAQATKAAGIPLVHVSTDYVFDGVGAGFYGEAHPTAPLGVYGASKLAGEHAVRTGNPRSVVMRTAWVLSPNRNNFLKTMLRLATDRECLSVVSDQHGCPTSAKDIAQALALITLRLMKDSDAPAGVYHFVNAGEASWCDLAREIFAQSQALGGAHAEVVAITTAEYFTLARRPANSRLSTTKISSDYGISPRPWQVAVSEIIHDLSKRNFAL